MSAIPLGTALGLPTVLFCIGLVGLLTRRDLLFMLLSLEIMLHAGGLAMVIAGARWGQPDGQVLFLFAIAVAAAESAVALAMILQVRRLRGTLDADALDRLKG